VAITFTQIFSLILDAIVLASSNVGKLREFQHLFAELKLNIIPQTQLGITAALETGNTFIENALLKARHAANLVKLPAIADDSGLLINALDGAPGIYSSRYAGNPGTAANNNAKVLREMHNVKAADRIAHFHCCLVFVRDSNDTKPVICSADWHGEILTAPQGNQGFGYDPIFYLPTHGCSVAELDATIKNQISHRAQAMQLLKQYLLQRLK